MSDGKLALIDETFSVNYIVYNEKIILRRNCIMILFTFLIALLLVVAIITIVFGFVVGAGFIVMFGDVIICALIIALIVRHFMKK